MNGYEKKIPGEPHFTLLARDPDFRRLVNLWADRREDDIRCGDRPAEDRDMVVEARGLAAEGADWRHANLGAWRAPRTADRHGTPPRAMEQLPRRKPLSDEGDE